MNQSEVLAEANKLVSDGLRKAAIDLLREYLDSDPNSTKVLSTLGRAYLLDRQPEKAVVYLKKSLAISQRAKSVGAAPSDYRSEAFGNDDMAFVKAEESSAEEQTFNFEDEAQSVKGSVRSGRVIESPPTNSVVARGADDHVQVPDDVPAGIHERLEPDDGTLSGRTSVDKPIETDGVLEAPDQLDIDDDEVADTTTVDDHHQSKVSNDQPPTLDSPESEPDDTLSVIGAGFPDTSKADKKLTVFDTSDLDVEEDFDDELPLDLPFADTAIDDNDELDDADLDSLPDELNLTLPISIDDESDDLDLEDLEGLDDFDEFASRVVEDEEDEDAVTREQRARQIAAEVLSEADWESIHLPLLQEIFYEKGWSATRKALEVAIRRGMTPDELAVAREIRGLWEGSDRYWTTFHKIKSRVAFCQADAAYKHMSWLEAIRITRSFPDVPDIEEVSNLIEEAYDQWYNSGRLRRIFKAFFKYLKYRVSLMRGYSLGQFALSSSDSAFDGGWLDSGVLDNALTPERQELQELGLNFDKWPRPSDNKIKIDRAYLEQDTPEAPKAAKVDAVGGKKPPLHKAKSTVIEKPAFGFGSSIWQGTDCAHREREK